MSETKLVWDGQPVTMRGVGNLVDGKEITVDDGLARQLLKVKLSQGCFKKAEGLASTSRRKKGEVKNG
jgi:hypothetical protein